MPKTNYSPELISQIENFTGSITAEHLCYVHSFVSSDVALFMPVAGPCQLAVTPMHTHPSYMFVISFSANSSIVTEQFTYKSEPNIVSFLPADIPHHEVNETGIPRYVAVFVKPEFLEKQARAYASEGLQLNRWTTFDCSEELLYAVKRFIGENQHRKPASDILLEAISIEMVHILLRSMLNIKATESANVSRIEINRSIEYMRQNLAEKLTLPVLAAYANMSVSHFTRVFRVETGRSPIDYLIEMRLEVACRKLLGNEVSHKQIAMECGFSSPAHFSSSFLKKFKISPSEYLHSSLRK